MPEKPNKKSAKIKHTTTEVTVNVDTEDNISIIKDTESKIVDADAVTSNSTNNLFEAVVDSSIANLPDSFEYVGFWRRFLARCVDGVIFLFITTIISTIVISPLALKSTNLDLDSYTRSQSLVSNKVDLLVQKGSLDPSESFVIKQGVSINCENIFDDLNDINSCKSFVLVSNRIYLYGSIMSFVVGILYFVLLTISRMKGTLGKKMLGLKVVNSNQGKISLFQSLAREVFWIFYGLSGIIVYFINTSNTNNLITSIGFLSMLLLLADAIKIFFGEKHQSLHDLISDTYVIKEVDTL